MKGPCHDPSEEAIGSCLDKNASDPLRFLETIGIPQPVPTVNRWGLFQNKPTAAL